MAGIRKRVKGFVHRQGVHCDSSALRDVFEYHGFKFSEPMIFGLGSGLGSVYWKSKQIPFPFVGGRVRNFAENLCFNLGVEIKINKTSNKRRAYETLKELISMDVPVMIHVDMPYLKYLDLPEEAHFGAHSVVVAGIDEEKGVVYIADTNFKELQTATLEELEKARSSQAKPFSPQNKWFTFKFPPELPPIENAIKRAVEKTLKNMLNPPIKNLGIKGIRHFASQITRWPSEYPQKQYAFSCEMAYVYLEEAGTGGGCFRYLFSGFWEETGKLLENEQLVALSKEYYEVGKKWTEVAHIIKRMPQTRIANSMKAKDLLLEIADDEERILCSLNRVEI